MKITVKKLERAGACEPGIKKFRKRWPDGIRVTRKNCLIAFRALKMDAEWAAENLLSEKSCQNVINAGAKACGECEHSNSCHFPPYCAFDKAQIEAFCQAARDHRGGVK